MGVCLVRTVSMSLRISPLIQGITQHQVKAIVPKAARKDVKIEVITPFNFPNHYSTQLVRGFLSQTS
jgi:DNA repair photolyase